jgi:5-methylcytosine-specific restriction endonuclease McrA
MKLRQKERCPIHKSMFCCGRERVEKKSLRNLAGVRRIDDPHHPRGYREIRSPAEMKKLLTRKIAVQDMKCGICGEPFTDCSDIVPDHIRSKGMGSSRRDDHPDNIQAAHRRCNFDKGSKRLS